MQSQFVLLLLAGAMVMCAQTAGYAEFAAAAKLELSDEALADARDAEILGRTLHKRRLTIAESADMEAAALRRLERRRASVARLQSLVDGGALPLHDVDASMEEVDH